jgi:hypothetical protein
MLARLEFRLDGIARLDGLEDLSGTSSYMKAPESNSQAFLVCEHDDDREFHVGIR